MTEALTDAGAIVVDPQGEEDWTQTIEIMQQMAQPAPEPGSIHPRDIVHKGDQAAPAPMVVSAVDSAGYAYVYDRATGIRSTVNRNQLDVQLKKKGADGQSLFVLRPLAAPAVGHFKCLLHPEDENRAHYDELGFARCPKANLMSPYYVNLHMQKCHRNEWKAIEDERKQKEEAEDRAYQRLIAEGVAKALANGIAPETVVKTRKAS